MPNGPRCPVTQAAAAHTLPSTSRTFGAASSRSASCFSAALSALPHASHRSRAAASAPDTCSRTATAPHGAHTLNVRSTVLATPSAAWRAYPLINECSAGRCVCKGASERGRRAHLVELLLCRLELGGRRLGVQAAGAGAGAALGRRGAQRHAPARGAARAARHGAALGDELALRRSSAHRRGHSVRHATLHRVPQHPLPVQSPPRAVSRGLVLGSRSTGHVGAAEAGTRAARAASRRAPAA